MSLVNIAAPNALVKQPSAYLFNLPDNSFILSDQVLYRACGGGSTCHRVSNTNGPFPVEGLIDLRVQDPFAQGAVAVLQPTGVPYIRTGNIWLLVPIPAAIPSTLTGQVPGHPEYKVLQQIPYTGGGAVGTAVTVPFNVPMAHAKTGYFLGADQPAFAAELGELSRGKLSIAINIQTTPWAQDSLKSLAQVSAPMHVSKGRLAEAIAGEVEKMLAASNDVVVTLFNNRFVKELSFDDLFLVDLVRMSRSTYQPTLALRV